MDYRAMRRIVTEVFDVLYRVQEAMDEYLPTLQDKMFTLIDEYENKQQTRARQKDFTTGPVVDGRSEHQKLVDYVLDCISKNVSPEMLSIIERRLLNDEHLTKVYYNEFKHRANKEAG